MINLFCKTLKGLIKLLPTLDLSGYITDTVEKISSFMGWINWLIPFGTFFSIFKTWFICVTVYFTYVNVKPVAGKILLKLFK